MNMSKPSQASPANDPTDTPHPGGSVKFPQFTRLFPALVKKRLLQAITTIVLLGVLLLIIVVNTGIFPASLLNRLHLTLPFQQYSSSIASVLGLSTVPVTEKSGESKDLEAQYLAWQEIVAAKPDYRDGYYALAVLAYKLGKIEESTKYLESVRKLDPNYEGIASLEVLLLQESKQ